MFFGDVTSATKSELIRLCSEIVWAPLPVFTCEITNFGHRAVGLPIDGLVEPMEYLDDRLGRSTYTTSEQWLAKHNPANWAHDPMVKMSAYITVDDLEKKRRRQRQNMPPQLHITLARRTRAVAPTDDYAHPDSIEFVLDRVVLYESNLDPSGVKHCPLASSTIQESN